jgi:hypothetical protein
MAGYSAYQSAPVTQQAVVTVNAGFDRYFCAVRKSQGEDKSDDRFLSSDDHCYTIQQRELVFRLNPKYNGLINRPDTFNGVNDMALKVFSSANNFPAARRLKMTLSRSALSEFGKDAVLRDAVTFVGVAVQPVDYLNTNQKDNVAVQIGGSCTVWNTGNKVIRPGQKIIWDFPEDATKIAGGKRKAILGEPNDKRLFATLPLESAYTDAKTTAYDFVSAAFAIHDPLAAAPPTDEGKSLGKSIAKFLGAGTAEAQKLALAEYSRKMLILYEELRTRVIGIALSGAAPGEVRIRDRLACFCANSLLPSAI